MEKTQREYYLNEQLKAIQKELGGSEESSDELAELATRIEKTKLSKEAREKAKAELKKLKSMSPMSAEGDGRAQLSRLDSGHTVAQALAGEEGHQARGNDPERGPLRAREGQGTDSRISRGADPRRQGEGSDPVPRRTAGRRQDLPRQVDRPRHRPQLRPHVARRRARRGRDPRPSAHLYRLHARQDHTEHEEGQVLEPDVPARRDRQARVGLARRSDLGAPGGSRPRAEPHLPGPLPRGRLRPVRRHVRDHGQHAAHAPAAPRPDGDDQSLRLHRGREGRDRPQPPDRQAAEGARAEGVGVVDLRKGAAQAHSPLYARGRRPQPRAGNRQPGAQGREGTRRRQEEGPPDHAAQPPAVRRGAPLPLGRDREGGSGRRHDGAGLDRGRRRIPLDRGRSSCRARA